MSEFDTDTTFNPTDQTPQEPIVETDETRAQEGSAKGHTPRHARRDEEAPSLGATQFVPAADVSGQTPLLAGEDQASRKKGRSATLILALVVILVAAYLAGAIAFMTHFMPKTTLNGQDVSLKSLSEVAEAHSKSADGLEVTIAGHGVDLALAAEDIKASFDGNAFARSAIAQQEPFMWPLHIAGSHELEAEDRLSFDAARLTDKVGSAIDAVNKDAEAPKDAKASYDKEAKRYVITPEEAGTTIDKSSALTYVREAMDAGDYAITLQDDLLVQPEVLSTDEKLVSSVDLVNGALSAKQELVTHDQTVATIDEDDLQKWVMVDDKLELGFDLDACTKWAKGDLSEKLDTIGSKRTYTRPDGREITVSGGTYGWSIDGAQIAEQVRDNVLAGKEAKIEIPWLVTAAKWNLGGQDWPDRYIDIDLGRQHAIFYDGGNIIWETDCVTGGMAQGKMHYTPTGVYYINSNMRSGDVELRGEIDPKTKKPEYISHVQYWMPFLNDSHALHDADWRSTFGGELYKSSGSHGCVNLPVGKAKELYGMVEVGTVVVVHD